MCIAKEVVDAANEFYGEIKQDCNGRYHSWEYCYYNFHKARNAENVDKDYLSLQLAFYLASWGMYRGSSFLLQKDYKIHEKAVELILDKEYNILDGIDCSTLLANLSLLDKLAESLSDYYKSIRFSIKGNKVRKDVSDTLITKILMGTLGCVPAYDRYFVAGIKSKKLAKGKFNENSIKTLSEFYINTNNYKVFEKARKKFKLKDIEYPQMKLLDMGFWKIGSKLF